MSLVAVKVPAASIVVVILPLAFVKVLTVNTVVIVLSLVADKVPAVSIVVKLLPLAFVKVLIDR